MDARTNERNKNSTDFNSVFDKAQRKNKTRLAAEFQHYACVNVSDSQGLFTPAASLAALGDDEAVEILKEFGASPSQIAMGYASSGQQDKAEALRKSSAINLKLLAIGAAMYEDTRYAEWLRRQYNLNPAWFIFGAALVGNFKYVEDLKLELSSEGDLAAKQREAAICMQIKGLTIGGHTEQVNEILNSHKSAVYLKEAIMAAAQVLDLYNLGEDETSEHNEYGPFISRIVPGMHFLEERRYEAAAIGAAKGGHIKLAASLFKKTNKSEAVREEIIMAAMAHGHITDIMQSFPCPAGLMVEDKTFLRHRLTLEAAVLGSHNAIYDLIHDKRATVAFIATVAQSGDLAMASKLAAFTKPDLKTLVERMDSDKYFQSEEVLLYALTFAHSETDNFASELAKAALSIKSNETASRVGGRTHSVDAFKHPHFYRFMEIYKRAKKIHEAMERLQLNYDQAHAYLEYKVTLDVDSVSNLMVDIADPLDSPVLAALSANVGFKLSAEKEQQFAKIHPIIAAAYLKRSFDKEKLLELPDQSKLKVEINLFDLIVKLAFNGFPVNKVAQELSLLTGLTPGDAGKLYESFCLRVLKQYVVEKLDAYINYNNTASFTSAPLARTFELLKRPVDLWCTNHTGRAQSIKEEVEARSTDVERGRQSIYDVFKFTKGLFDHDERPKPSPDAPKWQQPLDNDTRGEGLFKMSETVIKSRLINK